MAVLHDEVRAPARAKVRAPEAGRCALAVSLPASKDACRDAAERAVRLGFDSVVAVGVSTADPDADALAELGIFARAAHAQGLAAGVMISLDSVISRGVPPASIAPECYTPPPPAPGIKVDPRYEIPRNMGPSRLRRSNSPALIAWWRDCLDRLSEAGLDWAGTLDSNKAGQVLAGTLAGSALPLRCIASSNSGSRCAHLLFTASDKPDAGSSTLALAEIAMSAAGWIFAGGGAGVSDVAIQAINRLLSDPARPGVHGLRSWTGRGADLQIQSRALAGGALVLAHNRGAVPVSWPPAHMPPMPWQDLTPVEGLASQKGVVSAGEAMLFEARSYTPAKPAAPAPARQAATHSRRVAITRVSPSVDQGEFPVKTVIGAAMNLEADIFADGHEQLAACVLVRADGETVWTRYAMAPQPNDVWTAVVRPARLGSHRFAVQAWIDVWGGFMRDLARKVEAGQNVALEMREARLLMEAAAARAAKPAAAVISGALRDMSQSEPADKVAFLSAAPLAAAMAEADAQEFKTVSFEQPIEVEREAAQFSSWYELFPRSQGRDAATHGTFADAAAKLPHIAAMGFDTLYFPPIHPIGKRNRKGPNNSVTASPGDVGSPYAIGSEEGGHDAIHPQLGTLADFRALLQQAEALGLEVALDFAIQCAPDHPWLTQHPGWFDWRPDGSIKYAENPPKKYQDIVNVDFYAADAVPDLWHALRDVVLYWARQGIRSFRVDNPHTKPLPFWQWLIASVKAEFPDALFLSEAFTRPKPMYQLAKVGFSQSYTYFTWRNDKAALTAYFTELTQTAVKDYFRPHLFVNTPDINPLFLQTSGRPGFLIRAALAATLSGLWGMYAGFELCEAAALQGREEYLDSEKYQLRPRPARAPGDIVDEITQLNRLRRNEPALQSHLGVSFHNAFNDRVLYYSKVSPGESARILIAVSLDPFEAQDADIEVPLWLFDLADWQSVSVEDLLTSHRFTWTGKLQHIRLTPQNPYAIWRIAAMAG